MVDYVGKALLLLEEEKSWEEWANVDRLLNSWKLCLSILYFVRPQLTRQKKDQKILKKMEKGIKLQVSNPKRVKNKYSMIGCWIKGSQY